MRAFYKRLQHTIYNIIKCLNEHINMTNEGCVLKPIFRFGKKRKIFIDIGEALWCAIRDQKTIESLHYHLFG